MSKKSKRERRAKGAQHVDVVLDYYQRPFQLLHSALRQMDYDPRREHPIRSRFWQFVPPGKMDLLEARRYLLLYLRTLEKEIAELCSAESLTYFLHLYRRLSPGPVGSDIQPATIAITRSVFEAAVQKYSPFGLCNRIAFTEQIDAAEILHGLLLGPEFKHERESLAMSPSQLVLTRFDHTQLMQFYDLERLAYEIWRASATLRCIGKGAPFVVTDDSRSYCDNRSDELAYLLQHYDARVRYVNVAATGAVFDDFDKSGRVLLPTYNVGRVTSEDLRKVFHDVFKVNFVVPLRFNFVWVPFNLRGFRHVHLPLAHAFHACHGVSLDAVLAVIAGLCSRMLTLAINQGTHTVVRFWQRSYEGSFTMSDIRAEILEYLPAAREVLAIEPDAVSTEELYSAIDFWALTDKAREKIDLAYPGPHSMFLPAFGDKWFIDYAWILRRLFDLFLGVSISDQNYKGTALETYLNELRSVLPRVACRSQDGTQRQIDWAFGVGRHLVIAECKAVGRAVAFDRGDPVAIDYRRKNVVERALAEADEKAQWLAMHPHGLNYDISAYSDILPVGVSPFEEFIPSRADRYWVREDIPRVMTPRELKELVSKIPQLLDSAKNLVFLHHDLAH